MKQTELFGEMRDFRNLDKYRNGTFKTKAEIEELCLKEGRTNIFYVLSFGGGTQSTHLLENHIQAYSKGQRNSRGDLGIYSAIYFGDTGAEPQFIHEQVAWWKKRALEKGCHTPFLTIANTKYDEGIEEVLMAYIYADRLGVPVPLHTVWENEVGEIFKNGGQLNRACTIDFKIRPVQKAARQMVYNLYGIPSTKKFPKDAAIITDLGFSYDELHRVTRYVSDHKYMYLAYPLIEQNLSTEDSIQFLKENHMPDKRSRCYLCPYNCNQIGFDWMEIIESEPFSFLKTCYFDDEIRRVTKLGKKNIKTVPYFHHSRQPLKEVYPKYYEFYSMVFEKELADWESDWREYILKNKEKYEVGKKRYVS